MVINTVTPLRLLQKGQYWLLHYNILEIMHLMIKIGPVPVIRSSLPYAMEWDRNLRSLPLINQLQKLSSFFRWSKRIRQLELLDQGLANSPWGAREETLGRAGPRVPACTAQQGRRREPPAPGTACEQARLCPREAVCGHLWITYNLKVIRFSFFCQPFKNVNNILSL